MEPTEWKQQSPERQRSTERRSTGKPAESHQSRQGLRIIQGKRLQCKSSFHPLPTHTSKWSRPRLCRLPYSPRAHTQRPCQSSRRLRLTLAWGPGRRPEKDELTVLLHLYVAAESLSLPLFKNLFL